VQELSDDHYHHLGLHSGMPLAEMFFTSHRIQSSRQIGLLQILSGSVNLISFTAVHIF
jgi:hypothetical protein